MIPPPLLPPPPLGFRKKQVSKKPLTTPISRCTFALPQRKGTVEREFGWTVSRGAQPIAAGYSLRVEKNEEEGAGVSFDGWRTVKRSRCPVKIKQNFILQFMESLILAQNER